MEVLEREALSELPEAKRQAMEALVWKTGRAAAARLYQLAASRYHVTGEVGARKCARIRGASSPLGTE